MEMTFDGYIKSPNGSRVFTNKQVYYDLYKDKLDKILVRETGKIKYDLYEDKKKGTYYIHMKVPSEPIAKFYYDVVIEFYTNDPKLKDSKSVKDYFIKFYSNDPAFVYTFAHAMAKNNLFIDDLSEKMSKKPLKSKGIERNPKDEIGYVKSLYFAYLTILRYGLFEKVQFTSYAKPYDKKVLLSNIEHADIKIAKRQELGAELDKAKRIAKTKLHVSNSKLKQSDDSYNISKNNTKTTMHTNSSHTTKKTNVVKRSSMTKRTNKI